MTFGPPDRFHDIYLSQSSDVTVATPPEMRSQLRRVGLGCGDLTDESLQYSIDTIRANFPTLPQANDSYLIGEPVDHASFEAGTVLAGVRDLLPVIEAAPRSTQLLVNFLASTNPGTRAFVRQLFDGDTAALDLQAQVVASRPEAETFVGRLADAGQDAFLPLVEEVGSPGLRFLANLADTDLQPTAVGTWVPKAGGVWGEAQMTTMYKNWDRMAANMGADFIGVHNTWPSGSEKYTTNDAFEALFVRVSLQASAALVAGLAKPDMEAMLANRVKENTGHDPNNYDTGWKPMTVFLVGDYNPADQTSAGVGFLSLNYRVQIKDFRKKSKDSHNPNTTIDGRCQACMFGDMTTFDEHATAAGWTGRI
jgi:hypothetical protein